MSDSPTGAPSATTRDRLSLRTLFAFGTARLPVLIAQQSPKDLSFQIYNVALGVNPAFIGAFLALARLWDAITDPIMGHLSDRTRTRWGRRRPYLFVGAFALGLAFMLLWFVPRGLSPTAYSVYFAVTGIVFYTALTIYAVPYGALLAEMTPDYHERTRLTAFMTVIGALAGILVPWTYAFSQWDIWSDTIEGIRIAAVALGLLIVVLALVPAFFIRERYYDIAVQTAGRRKKKIGGLTAFKQVMANRPFQLIALAALVKLAAFNIVKSLGFYINVYFLYGGDTKPASIMLGFYQIAWVSSTIASVPLFTWLSRRIGKRRTVLIGLAVGIFGTSMKWFLYRPDMPWLQIFIALFLGPGVVAFEMVVRSMIADVVDHDELQHGERREGVISAGYGWAEKVGLTLATTISGFVLVWIGFDQALGGGQSETTILWMRILYAILPGVGLAFAFWLIFRFPLDETRMAEIRTELEARRGAA